MKKRFISSIAFLWLGAASASGDVSEMIFYPEGNFSEGIVHFSYQGAVARDYGFIFDKGVDADRIVYVRPANHLLEKRKDGLIKLSFPNTNSYAYLQKLLRNDFVISEEKGVLSILLSGGDCMSSPECVTEENILTVAIPGGYRVKSYKGLDHELKALHDARWQIKGNVYTLVARNVKGASLVMQLEQSSPAPAAVATRFSPPVAAAVASTGAVSEARSRTFRNDRLFERGTVQLSLQGKKELEAFARGFKPSGEKKILVEAHTDNVPPQRLKHLYPTNQSLSEARAGCVAGYLKTLGIEPSEVAGYGESRPVATNLSEYGRLQNGRIELIVKP